MKILITSVGSLVGQNILDVLENPAFSGRENIEVIGTNSIAASPQNFRCDRAYIVSNTSTHVFCDELKEIIEQEAPDLVLSGRDEDTLRVTQIVRESNGNSKLPYGSIASLENALDKLKTYNFCKRYSLPFAESFVLSADSSFQELLAFSEKNKYPLIAKPIQGFASKGVYFIRNDTELESASHLPGYMFQEYLGDENSLQEYFKSMGNFVPLFASAPNIYHYSCHTIMHPDGSFKDIFISRNEHESGMTVGLRRVYNNELYEITNRYLKAIHKEGGFGPMTVQFREDRNGNWKAQEMNMRTNGNTYARFIMGQDDIGEIISYLYPDAGFIKDYEPKTDMSNLVIGKALTSYAMDGNRIDILKSTSFLDNKRIRNKNKKNCTLARNARAI